MMFKIKFKYENEELNILDILDNAELFNYSKTVAGHMIEINPKYELIQANKNAVPNIFLIKKKE